MIYREYGKSGLKLSIIGLGGHEFGKGGVARGFGDDFKLAVTPGYVFPGFGGEDREEIVKKALDFGINVFDLTIDAEKDAIGRILQKLQPSEQVILHTRPEGMGWFYDPGNRKMLDYTLLKAEAVRILKLLRRETIDILNFPFMVESVDADPDYFAKLGHNIGQLKKEGLIRFASADTYSGDDFYVRQIETDLFDSIFINYNIGHSHVDDNVFPKIKEKRMGVFCREAFMKGKIFQIAEEVGILDKNYVTRICLKWMFDRPEVTSVIFGVSDASQLESNLKVLDNIAITSEDQDSLDKLFTSSLFKSIEGVRAPIKPSEFDLKTNA